MHARLHAQIVMIYKVKHHEQSLFCLLFAVVVDKSLKVLFCVGNEMFSFAMCAKKRL